MEPEHEGVTFSGVFTPQNARLARWALRKSDPRGYIGGTVGLVLVLLPFMAEPPIRGLNAAIILASGVCILFLFWIQPEIRVGKGWRRLKNQIPVTGWVGKDGLTFGWDGSESRVSWSNFTSVKTLSTLLLLQDSAGHPTYLPRSFFTSDADWRAAVETVRSRVAPHRD